MYFIPGLFLWNTMIDMRLLRIIKRENLRLELSIKENPNNDRNLHYLGREYMYYKRWEECIYTLKRHLELIICLVSIVIIIFFPFFILTSQAVYLSNFNFLQSCFLPSYYLIQLFYFLMLL